MSTQLGTQFKVNAQVKELEFKSLVSLEERLRDTSDLSECPDEVFIELARHLHEGLNRKYKEIAREVYQSTLAATLQVQQSVCLF